MSPWTTDNHAVCAALAALAAAMTTASYYSSPSRKALAAIPAVGGPDLPILSWWSSLRFALHGNDVLREGYEKHHGKAFKVGFMNQWAVVLSGPALIDELRRQPAEVMSLREATNLTASLEQSLGPDVTWDMYINELALSLLTKNSEALFKELQDEVTHTFEEKINFKDVKEGEEWISINVLKVFTEIITSVVLRAFVGLPLSRDKDWVDLNMKFAGTLAAGTVIINLFPTAMKGFAKDWLTSIPRTVKKATDLLRPLVEERLQAFETAEADGTHAPDDVLARIVAHYRDVDDGVSDLSERIALRILLLDIVALSTTLLAFTHTLYTLAANPDSVTELRAEAEGVLAEHGRSKAAMSKLYKLDAYVKEVMRLQGGGVSLQRVVNVPYTFSDGTFVPAGTLVTAVALEAHQNEMTYPEPTEFKPERFLDDFKSGGGDSYRVRQSMSTTSNDYLAFGHGRYACPGRFFASTILKLMLVHLITNYDVKFEKEGVRPKNWEFFSAEIPNSKAKVLFRKRQQ